MNIAYSCNDRYVEYTGISIISLLENNLFADEINIYLISVGVSENNVRMLKDICSKFKRNFYVIEFSKICNRLNINETGRHIKTVYAKLFFGKIDGVDKMIYLDSDTIILGSLKPFWDINLETNIYGLVKTISKSACKSLGLSIEEPFYNDGVAIVNCKYLRETNYEDLFIEFINKFNGVPPYLSEGVINAVCKGKIFSIPPRFNYYSAFFLFSNHSLSKLSYEKEFFKDEIIDVERKNYVVIHYLSEWYGRPWELNCTHPLKDIYLEYKSKSPWRLTPLVSSKLSKKAQKNKFLYELLGEDLFIKSYQLFRKLKLLSAK